MPEPKACVRSKHPDQHRCARLYPRLGHEFAAHSAVNHHEGEALGINHTAHTKEALRQGQAPHLSADW